MRSLETQVERERRAKSYECIYQTKIASSLEVKLLEIFLMFHNPAKTSKHVLQVWIKIYKSSIHNKVHKVYNFARKKKTLVPERTQFQMATTVQAP